MTSNKNKITCTCDDCGVNIIDAGEYIMINPAIWRDELGLDWDDNLCIGCVEKRLGRRIKGFGDIINMQANKNGASTRLLVRLLGRCITKRKPYRLKASIKVGGLTRKQIIEIGKARDAGL